MIWITFVETKLSKFLVSIKLSWIKFWGELFVFGLFCFFCITIKSLVFGQTSKNFFFFFLLFFFFQIYKSNNFEEFKSWTFSENLSQKNIFFFFFFLIFFKWWIWMKLMKFFPPTFFSFSFGGNFFF